MPKDQQSAEKDLLKIIEGGEEKDKSAQSLKSLKAASLSSLSSVNRTAESGKRSPFNFDYKALLSNSTNINGVLAGALACVIVYFAINLLVEFSRLKNVEMAIDVREVPEDTQRADVGEGVIEEGEMLADSDLSELEVEGMMRNIFRPGPAKPEVQTEEDVLYGTRVSHLKLVGISIETNPEDSYAMVENTKSKITFFLKKGETLDGLFVKEVLEEKVVFESGGTEVELR